MFPEYLSIIVLHLSNCMRNMVYFLMWIMTSDIFSNVLLVCGYYLKIKKLHFQYESFCGLFNPGRDSALFIYCHIITTRSLNPCTCLLLCYITASRAS